MSHFDYRKNSSSMFKLITTWLLADRHGKVMVMEASKLAIAHMPLHCHATIHATPPACLQHQLLAHYQAHFCTPQLIAHPYSALRQFAPASS